MATFKPLHTSCGRNRVRRHHVSVNACWQNRTGAVDAAEIQVFLTAPLESKVATVNMPPAEARELAEDILKHLGEVKEPAPVTAPYSFPEMRSRFTESIVAEHTMTIPVRSGEDVYDLLHNRIAHETQEVFYAIYIDTKGRVIESREISRGTISSALVHPREVFAPALVCGAAAVIVAHNHPSGDPEPSADDRTTTKRLVRAGRLLGVELLDHVIIGHGGLYKSFLEEGWL